MNSSKRILLLCACCLSLTTTQFAAADFLGMEVDTKNEIEACTPAGGLGLDLMVCNFYAAFDNGDDRLLNLSTKIEGGMPITVSNGQPYYQNMFGGFTAPNCAFFDAFPTVACDTFVTIGRKCSNNPRGTCEGDGSACDPEPCADGTACIPNPLFGDNTGLDPDYNVALNVISGGWFATPFGAGHPVPFSSQGNAGG